MERVPERGSVMNLVMLCVRNRVPRQTRRMTTTQLRTYQLPADPAERDEWLAWFQEVRAMRERHGFNVVVATLDADTGEFNWLVEYDGDDFAAAEQVMVASADRAEVFARPRPTITIIRTVMVERV